jgi:hypothetical protein
VFLFFIIWFIGGMSAFLAYIIEPHPIILLPWGLVAIISLNTYLQRAYLEEWVCVGLQSEWKYIEKPLSKLPFHISLVSLFAAIIFTASIIVLVLALVLASYFGIVLWISCDGDISKFGENINNYTSIILVFIFMAQAWIFYQQYRHMKQPFFKAPLFWTLSKSNSDTDCCILLKNGGNAPIFNISYHILEVSVNDILGYKIIKSKEISNYFLPRLDGGFEKEIFGKPTKEFKEMRLAVYLSVKTLDGHSTSLFFYKAPGDLDFRLAGSVHT